MQGLRTSSVLVLDDCDDDAQKIQEALAFRGIGAIMVPGGSDRVRTEDTIRGVRVAVLDINLGVGTDGPSRVRHTRGVVEPLIDARNGPYVAVVWTTNEEDFSLFEEQLREMRCPPIRTEMLAKDEVLDLEAKDRAEKILEAVERAISGAPPLEFANRWEQIVRDAANDAVVDLEIARASQGAPSRSMALLAALLRSEATQVTLQDDTNSMRALLTALNPVHFDKVEELSMAIGSSEAAAVSPIRLAARNGTNGVSLKEQSRLNGSLLFDRRTENFGPGRLYLFDEISALGIGSALAKQTEIRCETVEPGHLDRAGELPVVFLEVSAACDHQQGKIRMARLIAGVVFDASKFQKIVDGEPVASGERIHARKAGYLRTLDPVMIPSVEKFPADAVRIVLNAHYPVAVSIEEFEDLKPLGRFREPVLADVRAWLGYQSGRPGYASVQ